ncbi:MAG: hypothetical protein JOY97_06170, partial [Hyphomicrobiales bacterium]|nr:hypothetical protein [Hyphomicrobiales bacterium]
ETTAGFGKRRGSYRTIEQEFEFEGVPTQSFSYELSAHVTDHSINGVEGIDNIDRTQFSGFSTTLSYLIIGRGPGSPIGLTFAVAPEWARIDGTSGVRTQDFSTAFRLIADTEIIPNRLYAAVNALYHPEIAKPSGDLAWSRTATAGVTGGLAYRVAPPVTVGGEVEYYRAYEGLASGAWTGTPSMWGRRFISSSRLKLTWPWRSRARSPATPREITVRSTSSISSAIAPTPSSNSSSSAWMEETIYPQPQRSWSGFPAVHAFLPLRKT